MDTLLANPLVAGIQRWTRKKMGRRTQPIAEDEEWQDKAIQALLKKLKSQKHGGELAVRDFEDAVKSQDRYSRCVILERSADGRIQVASRKGLPHFIYCRIFRFPDLTSHNQLRSFDNCKFGYSTRRSHTCVNPYHYERTPDHGPAHVVMVPLALPGVVLPTHSPMVDQRTEVRDLEIPGNAQLPLELMDLDMYVPASYDSYLSFGSGSQGSGSSGISSDDSSEGSQNSGAGSLGSPTSDYSTFNESPPTSYTGTTSPGASYSPNRLSRDFSPNVTAYCYPADTASPPASGWSVRSYKLPPHWSLVETQPQPYYEPEFWASVKYWEMGAKVGDVFHGRTNIFTVDGFTDPSCADRFCVGSLSNVNRIVQSEKTRRRIGWGLRLSYLGGDVFLECLSPSPIFVQSIIGNALYDGVLDYPPLTVLKVPPGGSLKIFSNQLFADKLARAVYEGFDAVYSLVHTCTVRISLVKGWGRDYHRPTVEQSPCWIEINLNGPLQWLDGVLTQMGSPSTICSSNS